MKKILLLFFTAICLISCEFVNKGVALQKTTMAIKDPVRNYWPIVQGDKLDVSYEVTNTGENTLVLADVQASCGCIATKFSQNPIAPGQKGFINLQYDSDKNIGLARHYLTIRANIDSVLYSSVNFSVNVVPNSHYTKDYEELFAEKRGSDVEKAVDGDQYQRYFIPGDSITDRY